MPSPSEIGHPNFSNFSRSYILFFEIGLHFPHPWSAARLGTHPPRFCGRIPPRSKIGYWSPNFNWSPISERGDVRSQKRKKRRGGKGPLKYHRPEKGKIRGTLVRLLWQAAAPGLKPLRLSRAQNGEFWKRTQGKWRPRFESSPPSGQ